MEWATVVGDSVLAAGGLATAVIAARANRHAKTAAAVGRDNAVSLEQVRKQTDGRQHKLIKRAVEEFAHEHPQLLTEAISETFVRTVLETILETADNDGEQP